MRLRRIGREMDTSVERLLLPRLQWKQDGINWKSVDIFSKISYKWLLKIFSDLTWFRALRSQAPQARVDGPDPELRVLHLFNRVDGTAGFQLPYPHPVTHPLNEPLDPLWAAHVRIHLFKERV
jgi:hypothetical protein